MFLGMCDSCQEVCQSSGRCERYCKAMSVDGEVRRSCERCKGMWRG